MAGSSIGRATVLRAAIPSERLCSTVSCFVSAAADEIEAPAKIDHSFRRDAGNAGWIQPHCSWRALSHRRHCGDISRRSLADDMCALIKADATPRGSAGDYWGGRAAIRDYAHSGSVALRIL